MAFMLNPNYGAPGAPQYMNWWDQNRFMMSVPPGQQAQPPSPMAPALTAQDIEAHQGASQLAPRGGMPGMGSDGGNGMERDSQFADPTRAATSSAGTERTPANFNSNYGAIGGTLGTLAGLAAGVPGPGLAGGILGNMVDTSRYAGVLGQAGIPFSPNYGSAALAGATSLPFGLGHLLGDSPRQQFEDARRGALANGVLAGNVSPNLMPGPIAPLEPTSFWSDIFGSGASDQPNIGYDQTVNDVFAGGYDAGYGGMSGGNGGVYGFAKGGRIPHPMPGMHDPPGPDDQIAAVQSGEGVLTRKAMKRHPGLLDALNRGDMKRARGLLR